MIYTMGALQSRIGGFLPLGSPKLLAMRTIDLEQHLCLPCLHRRIVGGQSDGQGHKRPAGKEQDAEPDVTVARVRPPTRI